MKKYIVGTVDETNKNGRTYPRALIENAIKEYMKVIREKKALGEFTTDHDSTINLENVSHIVDNMEISENNILAKITLLTTPKGKLLSEALNNDGIYFAMRGLGKLDENKIVSEYTLLAIDAYEI